MNTIGYIAACVVLCLIVLAKIPGLEHAVRPAIGLVFDGLKICIEAAFNWTLWLVKSLWFSHFDLARHLLLTPEKIDRTYEIRGLTEVQAATPEDS